MAPAGNLAVEVRIEDGTLEQSGELFGGRIRYWVPEEDRGRVLARGTWDPAARRWRERKILADPGEGDPLLGPVMALGLLGTIGPGPAAEPTEIRMRVKGRDVLYRAEDLPGSPVFRDGRVHRETHVTVLVGDEVSEEGDRTLDGVIDPATGFLRTGEVTTNMETRAGMAAVVETRQVHHVTVEPVPAPGGGAQ